MNRTEIIQAIIDATDARTYLEIGVYSGTNFFQIRADRKIAIDPEFRFRATDRVTWKQRNPSNRGAQYHSMTSETFFASSVAPDRIDVAFIDGLHTYRQSLRDTLLSLDRMDDTGIVILHDCNPPHAAAGHPAPSFEAARALRLPGWNNEWCGDVWKTVCHLRSLRPDLQVFVLDCDFGVGVVSRGVPDDPLQLDEQQIEAMTYEDMDRDRSRLLNLREPCYLRTFLDQIRKRKPALGQGTSHKSFNP